MVAIPCGGYSPRGDFPWGNFVEATSLEPFSCSIPLSVHMFDLLKKKKKHFGIVTFERGAYKCTW